MPNHFVDLLPNHKRSCLRALDFIQIRILDDASHIDLGFPQELYGKEFPRALRYGGMRDQILV